MPYPMQLNYEMSPDDIGSSADRAGINVYQLGDLP